MFLADCSSQERPSARAAGPSGLVCQNFEGKGHTPPSCKCLIIEAPTRYVVQCIKSSIARLNQHLNIPRLRCRSFVAQTFFASTTSTVFCLHRIAFTPILYPFFRPSCSFYREGRVFVLAYRNGYAEASNNAPRQSLTAFCFADHSFGRLHFKTTR